MVTLSAAALALHLVSKVPLYSPVVARREPVEGVSIHPATRNVRADEHISPQMAPDPERRGSVPARMARQQVYTAFHLFRWEQDDFLLRLFAPSPLASVPRGAQSAMGGRVNIQRSPAVAYGSMFEFADPVYGAG